MGSEMCIRDRYKTKSYNNVNSSQCAGYDIPQTYIDDGFDTNKKDLVIFVFEEADSPGEEGFVASCMVERRPVYGLMSVQIDWLDEIWMQSRASFFRNE